MAKECLTEQGIKEQQEEAKGILTNYLKDFGWKSEVAGGVAGAFIASNMAHLFEDEDNAGWYQVGGAIIGAGMGRHKASIIQGMDGFVRKADDHIPDNKLSSLWRKDVNNNKTKQARNAGVQIDINDDESVSWGRSMFNSFLELGKARNNMYEAVFENSKVMSMFSTLSKFNIPTANKLRSVLQTINNTVNQYKLQFGQEFNAEFGTGSIRKYVSDPSSEGSQLIKSLVKSLKESGVIKSTELDRIDDEQAYKMINEAVVRIIGGGGKLVNGQYVYKNKNFERGNIVFEYKDKPYKEIIDRELLKNEKFSKYVDSIHKFNTKVETDFLALTRSEMDDIVKKVSNQDPRYAKMFNRMRENNMTFYEYKKWAKKNDWEDYILMTDALDPLKDLDTGKYISLYAELSNNLRRFEGYKKSYFPQKLDFKKEIQSRERWWKEQARNDPEFNNLSKSKKIELWETKVSKDIAKMNGRKARGVLEYDEDGHLARVAMEPEKAVAKARLEAVIEEMSPEDAEYARANFDSLIKEREIPRTDKKGNKVLDGDGNQIIDKMYFVEAPTDRPTLFSAWNTKVYQSEVKMVRQGAVVTKSNHLEHSRETLLPFYLLDTNVDRVYGSYSKDVGERIHMLRNGIYSEFHLQKNYLDNIAKELQNKNIDGETINRYKDKLKSVYNVATDAFKHTDPVAYQKMIKNNQWANTYSDILGSAYGYGISFYNSFEWAVLTPLISSWKSTWDTVKTFGGNRDAVKNWTETLKDLHVLSESLRFLDPVYADDLPPSVDYASHVLDKAKRFSKKAHQTSADFSFSKVGGRLFGWDVENAGAFRLFIDGFQGGNEVATAMNARSALYEARKMAKIYKQLQESGQQVVKDGMTQWNEGRVIRQLQKYGIAEDKIDLWVKNHDKLDEIFKAVDQKKNIHELLRQDEYKQAGQFFLDIAQSATHIMHGTNKFLRPEFASSPLGRMVYKYQTYPFNFAFQNVKERIVRPLREFRSKHLVYADGKTKKVDMSLAKIYFNYRRGNFDKLKKAGFTDKAIEEMPIEVYEHILKLTVPAFGISVAGNMGLGLLSDIVEYPIMEALDQETFWRTKQNMVLNPTSPKDEQMTFSDLFDKPTFDGVSKMIWYGMGQVYQSGFAGAYGNLLNNRYNTDQGLLDMTMLGSDANDVYRSLRKTATAGLKDWAPTLSEETVKLLSKKLPIISSRPFSGYKSAILKDFFEEPKRKNGLDNSFNIYSLQDNGEIDF